MYDIHSFILGCLGAGLLLGVVSCFIVLFVKAPLAALIGGGVLILGGIVNMNLKKER